jgi:undecaprenyl-diphosphatase
MKGMLADFVRARLDPGQRYGLRVTLFALAVVLVTVPFGLLLEQVTSDGPLTQTDTEVVEDLHRVFRESDLLVNFFRVISFLGSPPWFYLVVGTSTLFFWRRGDRRIAVYLTVTNLVGGLVDTAVKFLVDRPRPELEDPIATAIGQSFPSGHAMASTVGYGSLLLAFMPFIPRRWRIPAVIGYVVVVSAIAFSRLGLGVHYMSDVLGGCVLGLAWLSAATAAFSIWRREHRRPPVEVLDGVEPEAG